MARKESAQEEPPDEFEERLEIARRVLQNPFEYITQREARILFNFGEKTMRSLVGMRPPMIASKINPLEFKEWIAVNKERLSGMAS